MYLFQLIFNLITHPISISTNVWLSMPEVWGCIFFVKRTNSLRSIKVNIDKTHRARKNPFTKKIVHENGPHIVKVEGHSNILEAKIKSSRVIFWGFLSK